MSTRTYKSPKALSIALTVAFTMMIGVMCLRFGIDGAGMDFVERIEQQQKVTIEEEKAIDSEQELMSSIGVAGTLVIAVLFIMWMLRVRDNAEAFGANELKNSRHSCIWSWFVPILNLVKPLLNLQEIFKASNPSELHETNWKATRVSILIFVWWFFWFVYCFLSKLSDLFAGMTSTGNKVDIKLIAGCYSTSLLAQVAGIVAAALAIAVVVKISRRQDAKYELVVNKGRAVGSAGEAP